MADTPSSRLAAFRASRTDGETIDADSGLTTADLDTILADRARLTSEDVGAELGDLA